MPPVRGRKAKTTKVQREEETVATAARLLVREITGSSVVHFAHRLIQDARIDIIMDEMITRAIVHEVNRPGAGVYSSQRLELSAEPIRIPASADDISLFNDCEYWSFFHMSRRTVRSISDFMRVISSTKKDIKERFSFKLLLELVLWYLSSSERPLTDGVKLFNLPNVDVLEEALDHALYLLLKLKEHATFGWQEGEYESSATGIFKEYQVRNVCGLMINTIFTALDKRRLVLHVVVDSNRLFKDVVVTFDTRPKVALIFTEKFSHNLLQIPSNYKILSSSEYGLIQNKIRESIVTPDTLPEEHLDKHTALLKVAEDCVQNMCKRFPRLNKLYFNDPRALLAGCVLYNYALLLKDLPPLV